MNKDRIELGIRAIHELEKKRDNLSNDIEICIVKIKTYDKEIAEITEILNTEFIKKKKKK